MLLPTDKQTLVLAGIPELLLWIIFLCMPYAVCLSEIITSENDSTYLIQCVYIVFQYLYCVY